MSARIGAMILAAGSGSRMGEIKQLILVEGKSLVRRAAQAALDGGCDPVTVVTGAYSSQVAAELAEGSRVLAKRAHSSLTLVKQHE